MRPRPWAVSLAVGLALAAAPAPSRAAGSSAKTKAALHLTAAQKDFLWLEPILVTVRVESKQAPGLPAGLGQGKTGTLRLKIDPPLKPRPKAKPLPLEGQGAAINVSCRRYDLTEWFQFPANGGTWKVRAVYEFKGGTLTSAPLTVTVRKPDKKDAEFEPVARIHHTPWSNYDTNAFCGDTFDLVKRWPKSRLAKYCHYWNGRFLQHKKDYAKAIASYRLAAEKYPDFALAEDAAFGIVECLVAQKKLQEARKVNAALLRKLKDRNGTGQTAVRLLADAMSPRLDRALARK
jgi:hypothetical protein